MKRRSVLAPLAGSTLLSESGCVAEPGTIEGLLEILETQKPSGGTVTPASDERIRSVDPIQVALDWASANGTGDLRLDQSEFDAVAAALTPLPWYERTGGDSPSGIYLRHEDETFAASLWPYCADAFFGSAESERGVYGRGGCLNPEDPPGNT